MEFLEIEKNEKEYQSIEFSFREIYTKDEIKWIITWTEVFTISWIAILVLFALWILIYP